MRVCKTCSFPALIAGDYGGTAPIPCGFCGGELGGWMHSESPTAKAARKAWFRGGGRQRAEIMRQSARAEEGSDNG